MGNDVFLGIVSTHIYSVKLPSAITAAVCAHGFYVKATLLMQTFGSKEHQASACTFRDSEIEHRVVAVGRPANLVRFTLQAGRWKGKELETE